MLTLNRRFVKAFWDCSDFCYNPDHFHMCGYISTNINDCPAVDKERVHRKERNGRTPSVDIIVIIWYNINNQGMLRGVQYEADQNRY